VKSWVDGLSTKDFQQKRWGVDRSPSISKIANRVFEIINLSEDEKEDEDDELGEPLFSTGLLSEGKERRADH
jgi:hypothetical protein